MIVRSTQHTLKFANARKQDETLILLSEWRRVMQLICDDLWINGYRWMENGSTHEFNVSKFKLSLPKYLDYNRFNVDTWLSGRMLSSLVTQLSGKLRSMLGKQSARIYVFDRLCGQGEYSERLWAKIEESMPKKPDLSDAGIEISSKYADFMETPGGKFYGYVRIKSTGREHVRIPVCRHSMLKKYTDGSWERCSGYLIDEHGVQLRWQKEVPQRTEGTRIGADQGLKTTMSLSNGSVTPDLVIKAPKKNQPERIISVNLDTIAAKMARKERGSRAFWRAVSERKNYVNYALNRLDLRGVKEIALENVVNVRYGRNTSRKLSHWSNPVIRDSLIRITEELGVQVNQQSSAYRSQRCSDCGLVRKASRKGKLFICPHCGLAIDADINAAKNHEQLLPDLPRCDMLSSLSKTEGFFWKSEGLFSLDGSVLRVPDS